MRERREREIEKRSYLKFESEKEEAHRFFWCFFFVFAKFEIDQAVRLES